MGDGKLGIGWWQGEDAWMQLMSGGTMGVVYGAASLWQWKISPKEEGWNAWASQPKSWKEALKMEGSHYVGLLGKILGDYNLTDIEKRWDLAVPEQPLLVKESSLYISFLISGGKINILGAPSDLPFRWVDPMSGLTINSGITDKNSSFDAPNDHQPWVFIIGEQISK